MKFFILSVFMLFSFSCSTGDLGLKVKFPEKAPILSDKAKVELKKNIAIKNSELFTEEEKEDLGILEIEIK